MSRTLNNIVFKDSLKTSKHICNSIQGHIAFDKVVDIVVSPQSSFSSPYMLVSVLLKDVLLLNSLLFLMPLKWNRKGVS